MQFVQSKSTELVTLIYLEWPVGRTAEEASDSLTGIVQFTISIQLLMLRKGI